VVRPHLRLEVRHLHPAHPRAGAIPAGLERKTDLVLRAMRSARLIDGPTYDRARADRLTLTPAAFQQ
jgi:membrane peptidoglycan carboxypeptidase